MRGLGSGGAWQIEDARRWGSKLVTSREFHFNGAADVLSHVPEGGDVIVSIDCDGIDPSVLAAVNMPTPGGLTYEDMMAILDGVATRGRLAGVILAELVPERDDPYKLSTLTAARMVAVALGHIAHRYTGKI
jgi:agmatinase